MSKSSITTKSLNPGQNQMRPVHPGEILKHEFLEPMGLSAAAVARAIKVPTNRITALLNENRGISVETALLLGKFFVTSAEFWLNLQRAYDLRSAQKDPSFVRKLASVKQCKAA